MESPFKKLINSYQKSLALSSENARFFSQIADFYYAQGKLEEALNACHEALQNQPDLITVSVLLEKVRQAREESHLDNPNSRFFLNNWITVDIELLSKYPDGINQLCKGDIDGMLIEKVFSKGEITKALNNLEHKNQPLKTTRFGSLVLLGLTVLQAGRDRSQYFQEAAILRKELRNIFEFDFEGRIEETLGKISGSRVVEIPRENSEQIYLPATFRTLHPNQGGIEVHSENEIFTIFEDSIDYLQRIANLQDSLNYFIVLDKPEQGGELILYDLLWEQTAECMKKKQLATRVQRETILEKFTKRYFTPDIGDMIIFKGERWHKVSDVKGKNNRITIGGFITLSKDEQKIFYWN